MYAVFMLISLIVPATDRSPTSMRISPSTFPLEWPFAFSEGVVRCEHGAALIIDVQGRNYALNGVAQSWANQYGYRDLAPMRLLNPEIPGTYKSFGTLILDSYDTLCN
jgi:hypothetical protein